MKAHRWNGGDVCAREGCGAQRRWGRVPTTRKIAGKVARKSTGKTRKVRQYMTAGGWTTLRTACKGGAP